MKAEYGVKAGDEAGKRGAQGHDDVLVIRVVYQHLVGEGVKWKSTYAVK